MPIPSDYEDLLIDLMDRTDRGLINWKYEGVTVEFSLDEDRLSMWAGTDEGTEEGFVSFALKDKHGETLDNWYLDAGDEQYDFMNRFYLAAKRQALGIPNRLARIRQKIGTMPPPAEDDF